MLKLLLSTSASYVQEVWVRRLHCSQSCGIQSSLAFVRKAWVVSPDQQRVSPLSQLSEPWALQMCRYRPLQLKIAHVCNLINTHIIDIPHLFLRNLLKTVQLCIDRLPVHSIAELGYVNADVHAKDFMLMVITTLWQKPFEKGSCSVYVLEWYVQLTKCSGNLWMHHTRQVEVKTYHSWRSPPLLPENRLAWWVHLHRLLQDCSKKHWLHIQSFKGKRDDSMLLRLGGRQYPSMYRPNQGLLQS